MTRLAFILTLFLAALSGSLFGQGQLTDAQQAKLDGHYAGIHQRRLDLLYQRAGGRPDAATAKAIKEETAYINGLRTRWSGTPGRIRIWSRR